MKYLSSAVLAASAYAMTSAPAAASLLCGLIPGRRCTPSTPSTPTTPGTPAAVPEIDASTAMLAVAAVAAALAFAWEIRRRRA